jgi:hypothetical protein
MVLSDPELKKALQLVGEPCTLGYNRKYNVKKNKKNN